MPIPIFLTGNLDKEDANIDSAVLDFESRTPHQVAEKLGQLAEEAGIDGFLISQPVFPGTVDGFVELAVHALERFPLWMNRMGFANQLVSDSNYLPMEVGRYVKGPFC